MRGSSWRPWAFAGGAAAAVVAVLAVGQDRDDLTLVTGYPRSGGAPAVRLGHLPVSGRGPSSMYDLGADRGRTVLLYFREGVACDPCWELQRRLEAPSARRRLGVQRVVSITRDGLAPVRDAARRTRARPPLSDPSGSVSARYGVPADGPPRHTVVMIGRDGRIRSRADLVTGNATTPAAVDVSTVQRALGR